MSLLVLREILVKGLLAFLLAMPLYPLMRRLLRPALVDESPGPAAGRSSACAPAAAPPDAFPALGRAVPPRRMTGRRSR